ncbi:MAG: HAD family hydrolase [Candidatus Hydrogenedentota bacterium]
MEKVKAITFDFWRTLFRDNGSDERKRMRMDAAVKATGRSYEEVDPVMTSAMRAFTTIHVHEQRTLSAADAVRMLGDGLGMTIRADNAKYLAEVFATAILAHPPLPIEGALEAVAAAAARYPIGIISDAGISPGSVLRVLLERNGFLPYFKTFAFSDEVGVSKPQRPMFERAAAGLGVEFADMLHIGDLEPTDIAGALAVGARAALFAGDNVRFLNNTKAHYTFTQWSQFRDALAVLG